MSELDDAGTYFDLGLRSVTSPAGIYHYMCTRNNNFSNRDQKGRLIVYTHPIAQSSIGAMGGRISLPDGYGWCRSGFLFVTAGSVSASCA